MKRLPCLAAVLLCGTLAVGGCSAASGSRAAFRHVVTRWMPDRTVEQDLVETEAQGALAPGRNGKEGESGSAFADATQASGGGSTFRGFRQTTSVGVLYWIGGGVVVLGVVVGYLLGWKLGAIVGAAGLGLIAATRFLDVYPWAVWVPVGIGGVAVVFLAYQMYRGKLKLADVGNALQTVVAAVESSGEETQKEVKANVAEASNGDSSVKATITEAKEAAGV